MISFGDVIKRVASKVFNAIPARGQSLFRYVKDALSAILQRRREENPSRYSEAMPEAGESPGVILASLDTEEQEAVLDELNALTSKYPGAKPRITKAVRKLAGLATEGDGVLDRINRQLERAGKGLKDPIGAANRRLEGNINRAQRFINDPLGELSKRIDARLRAVKRLWNGADSDDSPARSLSGQRVRYERAIEKTITDTETKIAALMKELQDGRIDIERFRDLMRDTIWRSHLKTAVLGAGGIGNVSANTLEIVDREIAEQFRYLDGFIGDLRAMRAQGQEIQPRQTARAKLYAQASRVTAREAQRQYIYNEIGGQAQERRVLTPADHCDDCVDYADQGWQPIGTLPPLGESQCGQNCKCVFVYRTSGQLGDNGDIDADELTAIYGLKGKVSNS